MRAVSFSFGIRLSKQTIKDEIIKNVLVFNPIRWSSIPNYNGIKQGKTKQNKKQDKTRQYIWTIKWCTFSIDLLQVIYPMVSKRCRRAYIRHIFRHIAQIRALSKYWMYYKEYCTGFQDWKCVYHRFFLPCLCHHLINLHFISALGVKIIDNACKTTLHFLWIPPTKFVRTSSIRKCIIWRPVSRRFCISDSCMPHTYHHIQSISSAPSAAWHHVK